MASPIKAPQARANKNLIITSKKVFEQHFLNTTTMIAAINPIKDIPSPAKNPNPQICALVRVASSSS